MAPASYMRAALLDDDAWGGFGGHNSAVAGKKHGGLVMIRTEPNEFYNFLKCPPLQKLNIQPV